MILYESGNPEEQHKPYFLSVPDLPQKFKVGKEDCLVGFQFNCFGFIVPSNSHVGLTYDLSSNLDGSTGTVFFITGFCLEKFKCEDFVYLSDCHSRDAYGRHVTDGHSVFLQFNNMSDHSKFNFSASFPPPITSLQYEIQFLKIIIDNLTLMQSAFTRF